jgi:hypothetical protein
VRVSGSNRCAPFPTVTTCTRAVLEGPREELFGVESANIFCASIAVSNLHESCADDRTRIFDTEPCFILKFRYDFFCFQMANTMRRYDELHRSTTASPVVSSAYTISAYCARPSSGSMRIHLSGSGLRSAAKKVVY